MIPYCADFGFVQDSRESFVNFVYNQTRGLTMDRSKIIAIVTGAIALLLSIAYLLIVQLLNFRGEMLPAPVSWAPESSIQVAERIIEIQPHRMLYPYSLVLSFPIASPLP